MTSSRFHLIQLQVLLPMSALVLRSADGKFILFLSRPNPFAHSSTETSPSDMMSLPSGRCSGEDPSRFVPRKD